MIAVNLLIFGEVIMSDKIKKKYYHNGIVNKMYEEGKQPEGFVLGMLLCGGWYTKYR